MRDGWPAVLLTTLAGCAPTAYGGEPAVEAAAVTDGLAPLRVDGLDEVWVRAGFDVAGYTALSVEPLEITEYRYKNFRGWMRRKKLDDDEIETYRKHFAEAVSAQLVARGRFEALSDAGPGVLRLSTRITDMYLNVGDRASSSSLIYVMRGNTMSMISVLRDAVTDEVQLVVVDTFEPWRYATYTGPGSGWRYGRTIFEFWSERLRHCLDTLAAASAPG